MPTQTQLEESKSPSSHNDTVLLNQVQRAKEQLKIMDRYISKQKDVLAQSMVRRQTLEHHVQKILNTIAGRPTFSNPNEPSSSGLEGQRVLQIERVIRSEERFEEERSSELKYVQNLRAKTLSVIAYQRNMIGESPIYPSEDFFRKLRHFVNTGRTQSG
ncbi:hypothetical protein QR680_017931 [Steinernema hermaphroditum]|uniref:Uncharacterized protein n=1 Tax=Steinernema hermaphroditum TaxID=289476 RepID=A0AA39HGC1_9BILA|nr:hypothetical protein QR680_017931 [Steinernema hermaphroditum]